MMMDGGGRLMVKSAWVDDGDGNKGFKDIMV